MMFYIYKKENIVVPSCVDLYLRYQITVTIMSSSFLKSVIIHSILYQELI